MFLKFYCLSISCTVFQMLVLLLVYSCNVFPWWTFQLWHNGYLMRNIWYSIRFKLESTKPERLLSNSIYFREKTLLRRNEIRALLNNEIQNTRKKNFNVTSVKMFLILRGISSSSLVHVSKRFYWKTDIWDIAEFFLRRM